MSLTAGLYSQLAVFIWRVTDCLEDMSQSAIVHDGIFGFGDERQNMRVEKEFEDAAAKGFRPCTPASHHAIHSLSLPRIPNWGDELLLTWKCRSGMQDDERHQSERYLPFHCL